MGTTSYMRAARALSATWRRQLLVLGAAVLVLGPFAPWAIAGAPLQVAAVVTWFELVALLSASIQIARAGPVAIGRSPAPAVIRSMPRVWSQVALASLPMALAFIMFAGAVSVHPLLGLAVLPIAGAAALLATAPALWALVDASCANGSWFPLRAFDAMRRAPLRMGASTVVAVMLAGMASLPIVLAGLLLASVAGPLEALGMGVAALSWMPSMVIVALGLHWSYPSGLVHARHGALAQDALAGTAFDPASAEQQQWTVAAEWDVALEPGAVWGTWFATSQAQGVIGVRCQWGDLGLLPQLRMSDEAGAWIELPAPKATGDVADIAVGAGNFYVQLIAASDHPRAYRVELLVPALAGAA